MPSIWPQHAPRLFTKLLKPVVSLFRRRGIRRILFLDDMLIMDQAQQVLEKTTPDILMLLQVLGFQISWDKSVLEVTQVIQYLGFMVSSVQMTVSLPDDKMAGIIQKAKENHLSIRELSRLRE